MFLLPTKTGCTPHPCVNARRALLPASSVYSVTWPTSPEVPPRIQRHQEALAALINYKLIVRRKKFVDGFHGTGAKIRKGRVPIHVRVFDNQIIAGLNEPAVGDHLRIYVGRTMIGIQDDHRAVPPNGRNNLRGYSRIDARPSHIANTRMLRPIGPEVDVNSKDSTMTKVVEDHGEK